MNFLKRVRGNIREFGKNLVMAISYLITAAISLIGIRSFLSEQELRAVVDL